MVGQERATLPANLSQFHELEGELVTFIERGQAEEADEFRRFWAEQDFFFFLLQICSTGQWLDEIPDRSPPSKWGERRMDCQYAFDFARDTQFDERDVLEIRSREHVKSTVKSFARNLHRIVEFPGGNEKTIAIISNLKAQAMKFLGRIMIECETNERLKYYWPDIFWANPSKQAKKWSLSSEAPCLLLQRDSVVAESTFEAFGLDKSVPTGPHFDVLNFDDIVTKKSTASEDLMLATYENWEASLSLGKEGDLHVYAGTFYHPLDAYQKLLREGIVRLRKVPCYQKPAKRASPTFYSQEYLEDKEKKIGQKEFAIQWLCNPIEGEGIRLKPEWLLYYNPKTIPMFHRDAMKYILVDGASSDKKHSEDFSVVQFWDVCLDGRKRLVDMVRDRLDPGELIEAIIEMWQRLADDRFVHCRYETYGMDSGIFHLKKAMETQGIWFPVERVGGLRNKIDRIKHALITPLKNQEILFPATLVKSCKYRSDTEVDLIQVFRDEEYSSFPISEHDDMLDTMSRLFDEKLKLRQPSSKAERERNRDFYEQEMERRLNDVDDGNWVAPSV